VRIEVQQRSDLVGGQPFGPAGPYEKISGKIFFAVDPSLPANRIVADLDKAPRNAAGTVESSSDFLLRKPHRVVRGKRAGHHAVSRAPTSSSPRKKPSTRSPTATTRPTPCWIRMRRRTR